MYVCIYIYINVNVYLFIYLYIYTYIYYVSRVLVLFFSGGRCFARGVAGTQPQNGRRRRFVAASTAQIEVDAVGVITISRGCFECSCSKK